MNDWPLWEVFVRSKGGMAHRHVGSVHAPDAGIALRHARDTYTRRMEGISLWVVPSASIVASDPGQDEALMADLRRGIAKLIEALKSARLKEGQALAVVLTQQLDLVSSLVGEAEASPARQPEAIRARLEAQIAELIDGKSALDPARLHQEAVLIAARADIREEIDRLRAHVDAARALLREGGGVGRRLDFLAQEFGREANTLCAKANDVSLSRIGLELKAVIEQFREQVQNVE